MADQIVLDHVTKRFTTKTLGDIVAVDDFNLRVHEGECFSFLGPSGCGKSTTLRMIAGFEDLTEGEIELCGKLVSSKKKNLYVPPEERGLGMVFQAFAVWPHMNVFENVAFPLRIQKMNKTDITKKVNEALHHTSLTGLENVFPGDLSGGQQQRIALARALVAEPNLLLLDEPLSNLDAKLRESMRFEIKDITKSLGISVVYVTHDQTEAMAMSDRIFLINNGIVQQSGTPDEIYNHPANQFVADFLGKVDFFKGVAENGTIHLSEWEADLQYPKMEQSGNIEVAIRPENIRISKESDGIMGKLEKLYYLGDETDCRVRVGKALVRVITDGFSHREFREGDTVTLDVREFIVFPDDGSTQDQLRIRT